MRWVLAEARERIMQEVPESLSQFAEARVARARHRGAHLDHPGGASARDRAQLSGVRRFPTRTVVWTAGVRPSPAVGKAGTGARTTSGRDAGRPHDCGVAGLPAVGDRGLRGGARPGTPGPAVSAHRPARDPPGPAGGPQRGLRAARAPCQAVSLQDQRRGRGARRRPGRGDHVRRPLARLPGLADRPHLPPAADAGPRRRLRLLVDWNVALLFGRDSSSPGRLGAPRHWTAPEDRPTPAPSGSLDGRRILALEAWGSASRSTPT